MSLTLKIDNYDRLETGGPTWITLSGHGCQAGRAASMDWVLPDPQRHVSGHHFEVSFDGQTYWLRDVSTNGTFLEGERHRMQGPVKLTPGMRFTVGAYIIVVRTAAATPATPGPMQAPDHDDPWSSVGGAMEPVNPMPAPPPRHLDDVASDFVPAPPPIPGPVPGIPPQAPVPPVQNQPIAQNQPVPETPPAPPPGPLPPLQRPPREDVPLAAPTGPDSAEMVAAFCAGAGIDPARLPKEDAVKLMAEAGAALRVTATEIMAMLRDRSRVKEFTGGGTRTMRAAEGNNPLKFLGDPSEALEALFLAPKQGYQFGAPGMSTAMADVRAHQAAVFAALQPALREMLDGLSPEEIEAEAKGGIMSRDKARWAAYVAAWDDKSAAGDNGMLDAFMKAFAQAYADATGNRMT